MNRRLFAACRSYRASAGAGPGAIEVEHSELRFSACENTRAGMSKREGKEVPLLNEAKRVPSGVVRLIELQEQGWSYIRP